MGCHVVDWIEVEKVVSCASSLKRLPDDTKAAIKRQLKQADGNSARAYLTALTVRNNFLNIRKITFVSIVGLGPVNGKPGARVVSLHAVRAYDVLERLQPTKNP